ncbi:MAG: MerR family transcriptional regulator [Verrucomicrobia bacterium]|nr:MerR family transcriptional regulator [Verrucomicrobiota bacterium]
MKSNATSPADGAPDARKGATPDEMSLAVLAARSGLPGRTIRFYIARGLVPGPRKAGRGAAYGPEHLERLRAIRVLQREGRTLGEVRRVLAGERAAGVSPGPVSWWQYPVAADVMVWVRAEASPWRLREIRKCINQLAGSLEAAGNEKGTRS